MFIFFMHHKIHKGQFEILYSSLVNIPFNLLDKHRRELMLSHLDIYYILLVIMITNFFIFHFHFIRSYQHKFIFRSIFLSINSCRLLRLHQSFFFQLRAWSFFFCQDKRNKCSRNLIIIMNFKKAKRKKNLNKKKNVGK